MSIIKGTFIIIIIIILDYFIYCLVAFMFIKGLSAPFISETLKAILPSAPLIWGTLQAILPFVGRGFGLVLAGV